MSLEKWSDYKWPKWVPQKVRAEIESFWSNSYGRDWREWLKSCCDDQYNAQPFLGATVRIRRPYHWKGRKVRVGKWIPAWNNMARIVLRDGSAHVISTCDIITGEQKQQKARQPRTTAAAQNAV